MITAGILLIFFLPVIVLVSGGFAFQFASPRRIIPVSVLGRSDDAGISGYLVIPAGREYVWQGFVRVRCSLTWGLFSLWHGVWRDCTWCRTPGCIRPSELYRYEQGRSLSAKVEFLLALRSPHK